MEKINVGLVGLGWPGQRHAEGVQGSDLGQLYAACDLNAARREAFAAKYAPTRVFADYDQMLADPELQAVVISLPNSLHFPADAQSAAGRQTCSMRKASHIERRADAPTAERSGQPGINLFLWTPDALFWICTGRTQSGR